MKCLDFNRSRTAQEFFFHCITNQTAILMMMMMGNVYEMKSIVTFWVEILKREYKLCEIVR